MTVARGARWAFVAALTLAFAPTPPARAGEPPPPEPAAPHVYTEPPPEPAAPHVYTEPPPEPAAPHVDTEEPPVAPEERLVAPEAAPSPLDKIRAAVDGGRFGTAVLYCEQALGAATNAEAPLELRALCGRAYVGLGDKLHAVGSPEAAGERWNQAAALDPRLLDDPAFTARLQARGEPAREEPEEEPEPEPPEEPARPADAGLRWDRGFGAGLGAGFDGAGAVLISWMTDGTIAVDFSVGLVYPVFDLRVRWFGLQEPLTPVVGLGMTTPFGDEDRLGGGLGSFHNLYQLGESFHVDLGVSWAPSEHLDVFAGVAFVTPVDQENLDTVLFFPQLAAQVVWYF